MSRASELEAQRLAAERTDNRCADMMIALEHPDKPSGIDHIAQTLLAEATYIAQQRKSGWKSRSDAHTAAGRILEQWAKDLAAYLERDKPPMRPPLETITGPTRHEHLDPADGPISAQITSGLLSQARLESDGQKLMEGPVTPDVARKLREAKTVDDKLDVVFGPVSPRAEIVFGVPRETVLGEALAFIKDGVDSLGGPDAVASGAGIQCRAEYPRKGSEDRSSRIVRCGKLAAHVDIPGNERHAEWLEDTHDPADPARHAPGEWGPEWDLPADKPAPVHITAAPANYAWCDATSGMRGYVGTATCPDCIARYDAYDEAANKALALNDPTGPMTGVSAAYLWPDNGQEPIVMTPGSAHSDDRGIIATSPVINTGHGPGVLIHNQTDASVRIDWNAKGETTVSIPQFSEPGAPPPRQTQQRLTFAQVREHGQARARGADHRSYSQVQAFKECGVKYALSDLDTPAWWNVGGTALHYACEFVNREAFKIQATFGDGPAYVRTDHEIETLWTNCLGRATSEAIAEHPTVDTAHWRAAKKGVEGYDWWRVNGVDMVRRWVARLTWLYDQGWRIAEFNGTPTIEYDCPMWIGSVKVENIIDLVMTRGEDGALLIIDTKSGASAPDDTAQPGQYAWALAQLVESYGVPRATTRIIGAYWLARTDVLDIGTTDLRKLHPWDELEYLITTMDAAESAGLYLPNKSKSDRFGCGSCGVRGLCPVGPS